MHEIFSQTQSGGDADWQKLAPVLDQAIGELGERDRDAVVLRFFEGRPFAEIGATLRLTEDAARMRVERALDKLRAALGRRGITSTTAALGVALANQAAATAPAGVAASVAGAAMAGAAGSGALATLTLMCIMKTGGVVAIIVAGATGLWLQHRNNMRREAEVAALQAEQREAAGRQAGMAIAQTRPSAVVPISERGPKSAPLARPAEGAAPAVLAVGLKPATNAGTATARATAETFQWAINGGDVATVTTMIRPVWGTVAEALRRTFAGLPAAKQAEFGTVEQMVATALCASPQVVGMQFLTVLPDGQLLSSDGGARSFVENPDNPNLRVRLQYADGRVVGNEMSFQMHEGSWRYVITQKVVALVDVTLGASPPSRWH